MNTITAVQHQRGSISSMLRGIRAQQMTPSSRSNNDIADDTCTYTVVKGKRSACSAC